MNFDNCEFNDFNDVSSLITLYKYGQAKFTNCTFDNIVADSIVGKNGDFIDQDGIYLYDCKFTNCNIKGVVDIPGNIEILDFCAIENCDYDFDATTNVIASEDGAHNYVNATKLAKPDTTLVVGIDDAGNLLVSLTAGDSAVANAKVLISVNGAEAVSYDLGEDGTLSIALSDLTDATGKLNIAVNFEETDDYKGSTGSASAVLVVKTVTEKIDPVATSITASDMTATAKIAKTLSITLKDANGNALANKDVKVTVNGKTSTVKTDSKGVAKVNVNYAKAGTYYYTFTYLGDNDYKASMKAVKVTVNKQATKATFAKKTFKVKATKKISFTLKDSKGKAIAKKKITFKVNGKEYTWVEFLRKVNPLIRKATDSEDKQMGEFFIKNDMSEADFVNKVMFYIWNDVCKDLYSASRISPLYFMRSDDAEGTKNVFTFAELFGKGRLDDDTKDYTAPVDLLDGFITKKLGLTPISAQTEE